MMLVLKYVKDIYWKLPFLSERKKVDLFYSVKKFVRSEGTNFNCNKNSELNNLFDKYRKQILDNPTFKDESYKELITDAYQRTVNSPKVVAYYLPQMHPTPENDAWWGKGVTEWNNVARAVPQYVGHYQPRLPGELGFYDLRLKENIVRQTELAKMYGIYAFCWYYYWFDGKRLLERPLDMYLNNPDINFPFCLCWANESWTKGFFGSSKEVIMKQNHTVESYKKFIVDITRYLRDKRYMEINGKKLLMVYKPQDVPDCKNILKYWREYCKDEGIGDLYIIGCWTSDQKEDFISKGFDAVAEFQPGAILSYCEKINATIPFVNEDFSGAIYSYKDIVENKIYQKNFSKEKMYHAAMPMWDNTPRRNNRGGIIFDGATPELFQQWITAIIENNNERMDLDDNLVFINAWNEWGEGAYLEPDKRYGYAYLQAVLNAMRDACI